VVAPKLGSVVAPMSALELLGLMVVVQVMGRASARHITARLTARLTGWLTGRLIFRPASHRGCQ
jgi:hypothetical protein